MFSKQTNIVACPSKDCRPFSTSNASAFSEKCCICTLESADGAILYSCAIHVSTDLNSTPKHSRPIRGHLPGMVGTTRESQLQECGQILEKPRCTVYKALLTKNSLRAALVVCIKQLLHSVFVIPGKNQGLCNSVTVGLG